jgi:hypothetical protein
MVHGMRRMAHNKEIGKPPTFPKKSLRFKKINMKQRFYRT